jgi:predicted extracellular nuclease
MQPSRLSRTPAPKRLVAALLAAGLLTSTAAFAGPVVISQIYGAGGNSGAPLRNDFVELFNASNSAVNLNGWSVQYASATGTGNFAANSVLALPNVILQPGQYFLIQQASGGANGALLPTADASGAQNMSGTAGKLVLVSSTTGLACNGGSTPCSAAQQAQILDLVGFGSANFAETSPAPAPSTTTAIFRKAAGCTDSNANGSDFETAAPAPRNSASPLAACGGGAINQPIVVSCPALTVDQGIGGSIAISASDADSTVNGLVANGTLPSGITLGAFTSAAGEGGSATATVNVATSVAAGSYSVPLLFSNDEAQNAACSVSVTVQAAAAVTRIHDIQGDGAASPLVGTTVSTEGIVTAVFPGLNGYYLQDESGDGNALTSDGVFVYAPGNTVSVGQKLRLTATVAEFNTLTELTGPTNVQVLGNGFAVTPTDIVLPEAVEGDLERFEGMLVRIVTPLTVAQNYFQGRYGQVTLAADGRLEIPTNRFAPGSPEAIAQADGNARRRIVLDDGSSAQNPNPIPFIGADNTLRAGDTVHHLTGVIDHGLITSTSTGPRDYKLHPTVTPVFARDNPRSTAPASVGGSLKVASFNVLNYFTTFTNGATADGQSGQGCTLGGATAAANCRGADNAAEFARQQAKIVAALKAINADVVGLMEIQNNGTVAVQNLVNALNAAYGSNVYAAINSLNGSTGTDAIRVAMIYKPAAVTPVGQAISDNDAIHNRPPLAQTFQAGNGEKFSVLVNHFKSKSCSGAGGSDADQHDGQACYNERRVQQASALLGFIETIKTQSADGDVLVIGDLNAYGMENPITTLTGNGLTNLIARHIADPYSYTFDGESGYLDHALASASLTDQVSGVGEWHINTDEPSVIDYNSEFKPQDLYAATPYRASDHDPVIVGLQLMKRIDGGGGRDVLKGTAADEMIYGGIGSDVLSGGAGNDVFVYRHLNEGVDTITDFIPAQDRLDLRSLLASIGYTGSNPFADGWLRAIAGNSGVSVQVDGDGPSGAAGFTPLLTLRGLTPSQIDLSRDFRY